MDAAVQIVNAVAGADTVLATAGGFEGKTLRLFLLVRNDRAAAVLGSSGSTMERVRLLVRMRCTVEGSDVRVDVRAVTQGDHLPPYPWAGAWVPVGGRRHESAGRRNHGAP